MFSGAAQQRSLAIRGGGDVFTPLHGIQRVGHRAGRRGPHDGRVAVQGELPGASFVARARQAPA